VVEEEVRRVTDLLIAVVGGAVGLVGGYVFGVLRTLGEHRNERRDAALAEIFKEMSLFYRYLVSWTEDIDPENPQRHLRTSLRGSTSMISTRSSLIPFTTSTRNGSARKPTP
jgi:hypothetical protein